MTLKNKKVPVTYTVIRHYESVRGPITMNSDRVRAMAIVKRILEMTTDEDPSTPIYTPEDIIGCIDMLQREMPSQYDWTMLAVARHMPKYKRKQIKQNRMPGEEGVVPTSEDRLPGQE